MEIKGRMYREGGQWKIALQAESWVLSDVVRESEKGERAVITVHEDIDLAGYVSWSPHYLKSHLLGTVLFEEESNKKDE